MNSPDSLGIAPPGIYEHILNSIRPAQGMKVLDVPCASGGFAHRLAHDGATCIAVDVVPPSCHKPAVIADMNVRFPFAEGHFDAITCIEGLEHVHDPFHVLGEFYRLLRPGGRLLLSTPNIHNVRSRIKFLLRGTLFWFDPREVNGVGHVNVIPYFILKHILMKTGFRNISVHPNRSMSPRLPAFVCTAMRRCLSKPTTDDLELNSATLLNAECLIVFASKLNGEEGREGRSAVPGPHGM